MSKTLFTITHDTVCGQPIISIYRSQVISRRNSCTKKHDLLSVFLGANKPFPTNFDFSHRVILILGDWSTASGLSSRTTPPVLNASLDFKILLIVLILIKHKKRIWNPLSKVGWTLLKHLYKRWWPEFIINPLDVTHEDAAFAQKWYFSRTNDVKCSGRELHLIRRRLGSVAPNTC